jgi:multiple sugar transport system permease protein
MLSAPKFIGFGNFIKLLGFHFENSRLVANDPFFWQCAYNTIFLMMIIPLEIMCALFLAIAMNQKIKGITVYRTLYFLPTITNGVAICILWTWIYNSDFGLLNTLIAKFGDFIAWIINNPDFSLQGPQWLTSTAWAKPSLMLMGLWVMMGGYNMILFLAALQGIPKELYEAANIDGAGSWHKFWTITWPMISPTTFFIAVMAVIGGFQGGFMQAYIMTGGGPEGSTTTLEYLIYNHLYSWQNAGYAASIAWFVFVMVFLMTIFNWKFGGKLVHY